MKKKVNKLKFSKSHKILVVIAIVALAVVGSLFIRDRLSQADGQFSWVDTDFRDNTVKLCKFNTGSTAKYRVKVVAVGPALRWIQIKVKSSGQAPHIYPQISRDNFGRIYTKEEFASGAHVFYDITAHYSDNTEQTKTVNKNTIVNCNDPAPRDDGDNGGGNGGNGGNIGGGGGGSGNNQATTQQLARRILNHPNIIFSNGAIVPMRAVANGRPAPVHANNTTITQTSVDPNLLRFILGLADASSVPIRISSFTNLRHVTGSAHYTGQAIDIGNEEDAGAMMPWINAHRAQFGINSVIREDDCIHVATR